MLYKASQPSCLHILMSLSRTPVFVWVAWKRLSISNRLMMFGSAKSRVLPWKKEHFKNNVVYHATMPSCACNHSLRYLERALATSENSLTPFPRRSAITFFKPSRYASRWSLSLRSLAELICTRILSSAKSQRPGVCHSKN